MGKQLAALRPSISSIVSRISSFCTASTLAKSNTGRVMSCRLKRDSRDPLGEEQQHELEVTNERDTLVEGCTVCEGAFACVVPFPKEEEKKEVEGEGEGEGEVGGGVGKRGSVVVGSVAVVVRCVGCGRTVCGRLSLRMVVGVVGGVWVARRSRHRWATAVGSPPASPSPSIVASGEGGDAVMVVVVVGWWWWWWSSCALLSSGMETSRDGCDEAAAGILLVILIGSSRSSRFVHGEDDEDEDHDEEEANAETYEEGPPPAAGSGIMADRKNNPPSSSSSTFWEWWW